MFEIARQRRLVEPVVAHSCFVDPARAGSPYPAPAHDLRSGVNVGKPFLLQLGKILHSPAVIAKKIHDGDAAAVIQPVVHLADQVVDVHDLIKPVGNADALACVCGKT